MDSIIIVHENIHSLVASKTQGFLLKLDIVKAYDRVDWSFLRKILYAFGFCGRVISLIWQLITTTSTTVIVNGSPSQFFKASRDLRQGDPISPILFTIMDESLGRFIPKQVPEGNLKGLKLSSTCLTCSHQQFVDETILMGSSYVGEARAIKSTLSIYEKASRHVVNRVKSSIFFFNTPKERQNKIANILGCKIGSLPFAYLGLPLGSKPSDSFWLFLIDQFNRKLAGWKGALLSRAGKIQLLKTTLQNLPVYALSLFKIPSKLTEIIEKILKIFLWLGVEERKIIPLVVWEYICKPKKYGALGIKSIESFNTTLLAKQVWRTYDCRREWNTIWHKKYLFNVHSFQDFLNSSHIPIESHLWNNIIKARDVANHGAYCKVGNGRSIRFWDDCWIGLRRLALDPQLGACRDVCIASFGSMVVDYWVDGTWVNFSVTHPSLS